MPPRIILLLVHMIIWQTSASPLGSIAKSFIERVSIPSSTSITSNNTVDETFTCFTRDKGDPIIAFTQCTPVLTHLLRLPDASEKKLYDGSVAKPTYYSASPCVVIRGTRTSGPNIKISTQEIVDYARHLLTACRRSNGGGIWSVDPKWYVALRSGRTEIGRSSVSWLNETGILESLEDDSE